MIRRARSINLDSCINQLPIRAYTTLANILDPGDMWEQFMGNIPLYLDDFNSPLRYAAQDGVNIRTMSRQKSRSPTILLLEAWSQQNPQIRHLIQVLVESELYAAADFLSVNILKGSPVPRLGQSTFSSQCTEPPAGQKGFIEPPARQKSFTDTPARQKSFTDTPAEQKSFTSDSFDSYLKPGAVPREHSDSSSRAKCDTSNAITQQIRRPDCTSRMASHGSDQDLKSHNIGSPAPVQTTTRKAEAIENDERDQMREKFKKIDIGGIDDGHCPRITYSILNEITDSFNNMDYFDGGRLLGSGGFGSVYLGVKSDLNVAVKRLNDTSTEQAKLFETELKVLSKFHHENLVSLLGYSCGPKFCLVYTYMVNGSVEDRLKRKNNTPPLTVGQRVDIAKGTAQGIHYLNSNNVIHRDIKSANVLLDEKFVPKVGDFATARTGSADMTSVITVVVTGTAAYLAPEAYQHDVSVKLDSYSYGVVLLELLTALRVVDPERDERDLKSHIIEHCEEAEDLHKFLDSSAGNWTKQLVIEMYKIAMKCLQDRKKRRVTIADILPSIQSLSHVNSGQVTSTFC